MLSFDDPHDSPTASNRLADVRAAILAVEAGSPHPTGETPVAPRQSPTPPHVGPRTPPWVPEGVGYDKLPEKVRAMIAEIIEPAYEQLVLRARDALEKTTGLTIVHLAWQEIVDQIDLARDYNNIGSVLNIITPNREPLLDRHLRLVYAKFKAANYLMRLRDFRRGLARTVRDAARTPAVARSAPQAKAGPVSGPKTAQEGESPSPHEPA